MTALITPAQRIPIANATGNVTRPWYLWAQFVESRLGTVGPSTAELETLIEQSIASLAMGVFGKAAPQQIQAPDIANIRAFLPRSMQASGPEDASNVLCNRTFARR